MIWIDKNGMCYRGILRYILGIGSPSLTLMYRASGTLKQGIVIKGRRYTAWPVKEVDNEK